MTDFLQLTLSGLASGTINFAQGEFMMLPAFAMRGFMAWGLPLPLALMAACAAPVLVLDWAFKRGIADPRLRHGPMPIVVATIGLSIAILGQLSVFHNLALGGITLGMKTTHERIPEMLALFPRINERLHSQASALSGGEQKQLEIGRVLQRPADKLLADPHIERLFLGGAPIEATAATAPPNL